MSADPSSMQGDPTAGGPSEDELRAAYEAELARISATDMIAQAAVSLLNIGAHRMGGAPATEGEPAVGQDLEQARDAIDGARALLEILERRIPKELTPLRDALSRLQMAYATESSRSQVPAPEPSGAQEEKPADESRSPEQPTPPATEEAPDQSGPGPAESSGRLWVPGR
jgi:hypothetical protein